MPRRQPTLVFFGFRKWRFPVSNDDRGMLSVPAAAGDDTLPGGLLWLQAQIESLMSDFQELAGEFQLACATDGLQIPVSMAELEEGLLAVPDEPGQVLGQGILRCTLASLNIFSFHNQRKIDSWQAAARIRTSVKSAMMKAGCCLTRGAVEELAELAPEIEGISNGNRLALRDAIAEIQDELPRFLSFVGSRSSESVTSYNSQPLIKYRQLFRCSPGVTPLGERCLFLLNQVRESSRMSIEYVKRVKNPGASGHGKGVKYRRCDKAIRDV